MPGLSGRFPATRRRAVVNAHICCGKHHPAICHGLGEHEDRDERLPSRGGGSSGGRVATQMVGAAQGSAVIVR